MSDNCSKYWRLFVSTLELSACTFGGGFVIIPLMKEKFVDKLGWIDEEEMLDLTAIAQSSPGAIAVNASVMIGYHVGGIKGSLVSVFGTIIPPLVIISVISMFYKAFRSNIYIARIMEGMLAGVAAVIAGVVIDMIGDILKHRSLLSVIVLTGSFIATFFLNINIILIIMVVGAVSILDFLARDKIRKSGK